MSNIMTGVARECITPPLTTPISGYFFPRYTKGVIDDLYATAVAFDDGENKSVIITLDLCGLKNEEWLDECKTKISEFCDVKKEAIMVNCSHTHTGPIVCYDVTSGVESNSVYDAYLMQKLRDVTYKAFENVKESKFYINKNKVDNFVNVRQYRVKDGTVRMCHGLKPEDISEPIGRVNNTATIIKIERDADEDILIVNFWCHADTTGGEYISADFIGAMRETLESSLKNTRVVFLQGAEGNMSTTNPYTTEIREKGHKLAVNLGNKLAGAVLQGCISMYELKTDEIKFDIKHIKIATNKENHRVEEAKIVYKLHTEGRKDEIDIERMTGPEALRILQLENAPDEFEFYISAISIGDLVFTGLPGEPFCEIGMRIIDNSPFKETIICALTNGKEIYFPTRAVMEEGKFIYEARTSEVKIGSDDIIVDEATALLRKLK